MTTTTCTEVAAIRDLIDRWMGLDARLRIPCRDLYAESRRADMAEEKAEAGEAICAALSGRWISHRGIEWFEDTERFPAALGRLHPSAHPSNDTAFRKNRERLLAGREEVR
jgi:hypothetical protein